MSPPKTIDDCVAQCRLALSQPRGQQPAANDLVSVERHDLRTTLAVMDTLNAEVERLRRENDMHIKLHAELTARNADLRAYLPLARAAEEQGEQHRKLYTDCRCPACVARDRLTPEQRAWLMEDKP